MGLFHSEKLIPLTTHHFKKEKLEFMVMEKPKNWIYDDILSEPIFNNEKAGIRYNISTQKMFNSMLMNFIVNEFNKNNYAIIQLLNM